MKKYIEKEKPIYIEAEVKKFEEDDFYEEVTKFTWEEDVERSWNQLIEKDGILKDINDIKSKDIKKEKYKKKENISVRKGIFRHVVILLDMSFSMNERDVKSNRMNYILDSLIYFLEIFFYKNPVGVISIISLKKESAFLIQEFSSNLNDIINNTKKEIANGLEGSPSLQLGLEIANNLLIDINPYGTREVLILFGSIRTCDKKNIMNTVNNLIENNIHVNCISVCPELYVLKNICEKSNGIYKICIDYNNLLDSLNEFSDTPLWMRGMEPQLIHICFPVQTKINTKILCSCHNNLNTETYVCNFCNSYTCKIPSKCKICGIYLISMQDLSHISNNLNESPTFEEITIKDNTVCSSCNKTLINTCSQCIDCKKLFCIECDIYIHEELNQCPYCVLNDF